MVNGGEEKEGHKEEEAGGMINTQLGVGTACFRVAYQNLNRWALVGRKAALAAGGGLSAPRTSRADSGIAVAGVEGEVAETSEWNNEGRVVDRRLAPTIPLRD